MKRWLLIALTFFVGTYAPAKSLNLGEIDGESGSLRKDSPGLEHELDDSIDGRESKETRKGPQARLQSTNDPGSEIEYKYCGNSFSNKFHRPWCPFSQAMNIRHVILFHFRCEAIAQGLKPCRYCLPPVWKSVRCRLLKINTNCAHQETELNGSPQETSKHQVQEWPSIPRI